MGYDADGISRRRAHMKKLLFISLAVLVGAGIVVGYRMAKGEGFDWFGFGREKVDPWTSYTPPAEEPPAGDAAS